MIPFALFFAAAVSAPPSGARPVMPPPHAPADVVGLDPRVSALRDSLRDGEAFELVAAAASRQAWRGAADRDCAVASPSLRAAELAWEAAGPPLWESLRLVEDIGEDRLAGLDGGSALAARAREANLRRVEQGPEIDALRDAVSSSGCERGAPKVGKGLAPRSEGAIVVFVRARPGEIVRSGARTLATIGEGGWAAVVLPSLPAELCRGPADTHCAAPLRIDGWPGAAFDLDAQP